MFNPLHYPICFTPIHRLAPSTWTGHTPFAMFLTEILKPQIFVELGTYYGTSYCAFCQAVKSLELNTQCYAIDTWEGDTQSGFFGNEVFQDLKNYHDKIYGGFSRLIQGTFDESRKHFENGTIDLLHIDGFHTYQAVKNDFEKWLPKMSGRGVILFHDINVKESDFGVWRFWDEIKSQHPSFDFLHAHGLGLLAVGDKIPAELMDFIEFARENTALVRNFFHQLGMRFESSFEILDLRKALESQALTIAEIQTKEEGFSARQQSLENTLAQIKTREKEIFTAQQKLREYETQFKNRQSAFEKKLKTEYLSKNETLQSEIEELKFEKEQAKIEKHRFFEARAKIQTALLEVNNGEFDAQQLIRGVENHFTINESTKTDIKLVIGIVTYNNSQEQIELLLKSIRFAIENVEDKNIKFEVFVIDNGSETEWEDEALNLTKHESIGNVGFGKAMNHLMAMAFADSAAQWFLCLNPDGSLHFEALNELIKSGKSNPTSLIEAHQFPEEHPKEYNPQTLEISWASGACLLISRTIYEKIGGFDPNFFMYMEDVDLSWRARAYGFSIIAAPKALFAHSVLDRKFDENTDRYCLLSGRYLAYKWQNHNFVKWAENELVERKYFSSYSALPELPRQIDKSFINTDVSTFEYFFHFSPARW